MRARAKRVALALSRTTESKVKSSASLRPRPLIRPPGTFSRTRDKGFLPISRRDARVQPFFYDAGEGLPYHFFIARRARRFSCPGQPFSRETGEGLRAPSPHRAMAGQTRAARAIMPA